ncbi:MAG: cell surface protein [Agathobacter sp.]|nr:cell surface protein [Agathobacter sp.]
MKYSKRYIVLTILLAIVFLFKFHILALDDVEVGKFRGGNIDTTVWYPVIADDVNSKVIRLVIDNKEYTSDNYTFYMDNNRNIMVPVDVLRDLLNCSAHMYESSYLMVEKHNLCATITLDELTANSTGETVNIKSPMTMIEGEYYVGLNDLTDMLGYSYSFNFEDNTLTAADTAENINALPAKYDLRERMRISPIRNQGRYGTCWAFGALTAMESALLPESSNLFSVDHMSMSNSFTMNQFDGGEYTMGMAYLAAWQGPVYEKDDPYGDGVSDDSLTAVKHVQEMRIIASKDIAAIKNAVFKYGGVQTSLYSSIQNPSSSNSHYNSVTSSYCYIGTAKPNHEVVIIGWDDNYSKSNFTVPLEGDGAFICQNSWGSEFGENGIFYVSYYDTNIGTHNVVYTRIDEVDNYDNIYQSDLCGWVGKMGYEKESMYGANVYTAKSSEEIVASAFYATAPDTQYKIYVVNNFEDETSFENKALVAEGTVEDAGYYTIDFAEAVAVEKDERYAVVVYVYTPGATHPMAIEYDSGDKFLDSIDLDDGEGYISYAGNQFINVKEKQDCNICIKAFTNNR